MGFLVEERQGGAGRGGCKGRQGLLTGYVVCRTQERSHTGRDGRERRAEGSGVEDPRKRMREDVQEGEMGVIS